MHPDSARRLVHAQPGVAIEYEQPLELFSMPGLPPRGPASGAYTRGILVSDATTGAPIPGVDVYGLDAGMAQRTQTNGKGHATVRAHAGILSEVVISPRHGYWSRVLRQLPMGVEGQTRVSLEPLPVHGDYSWGHRFMGFDQVNRRWKGRGVRVGIIDTGISTQEADVHPAGGLNTVSEAAPRSWNLDDEGHGTHCAGIVASLHDERGVRGGAPEAEIYSLKVFPGGQLSDLLEAVEWCIQHRIDVVTMSLGSVWPSRALTDAMGHGYARGITFIAAAGNHASRVAFPAANPWTIAVGAFGRHGTFPDDSAHVRQIGWNHDRSGQVFAAGFSNYGPEIDVCAPGVAILSTVPGGYAAWDGTSMACPLVTALVALILEASPSIRTGDWRQPHAVRQILRYASSDLGLPPLVQGHGVPFAPLALGGRTRLH
ncbi:MAG: S8 family serine peptidase [Deltaproteobacteria bacterium]|nr:S8 family serine peptidase [Deltaproteobacteria bacterium]